MYEDAVLSTSLFKYDMYVFPRRLLSCEVPGITLGTKHQNVRNVPLCRCRSVAESKASKFTSRLQILVIERFIISYHTTRLRYVNFIIPY